MGSFQDLLKARQPEIAALAAKSVDDPSVLANKKEHAPQTSWDGQIATGMQSSASSVVKAATLPVVIKEYSEVRAKKAIAVYEDNDFRPLKRAVLGTGVTLHAVHGFFYAADEEAVRTLDQYVDKKLVKKVDSSAGKSNNVAKVS